MQTIKCYILTDLLKSPLPLYLLIWYWVSQAVDNEDAGEGTRGLSQNEEGREEEGGGLLVGRLLRRLGGLRRGEEQ